MPDERSIPSLVASAEPESKEDVTLPRRDFLGVTAGALLCLHAGGCVDRGDTDAEPGERIPFDAAAIAESVEIFPRTPMAGEMKAESFLISGHVERAVLGEEPLTVRVWQPSEVAGEVFSIAETTITPGEAGFFKVAIEGLRGGEWYEYGFFVGDPESGFRARSLIGRVRTALAEGTAEPVRIAIAACVGRGILPEYVDPENPEPVEVWDSMAQAAEQDYDLFIHLGDQAYMDRVYDAGGSLEQYLAAWGAYHGGGYRSVYPHSGLYCTWDDHEVTNNGTVDLWTEDPEDRARIENAQRAYFTVMPIDAAEPGVDHLWRSFRWGDTVEFIVLDCRSERQSPQTGVYLGDEQFAFLLERLRNSPCKFKCIVNSVPFARLNLPDDSPLIQQLVDPEDRWEGYVTQRDTLKAFVDEHQLRNIVWITGDVHMCYVGRIESDPSSPAERMWEICVTSGNTNPLASALPEGQFVWRSQNGHLPLITFDPEAERVHVEFIAGDGSVSHSQELDAS
jgi:phosphodiesterase/alkaline phosphatase D-like protein